MLGIRYEKGYFLFETLILMKKYLIRGALSLKIYFYFFENAIIKIENNKFNVFLS